MSEDYLWDRSGEKDDLVVDLENLFSELGFDAKKSAPVFVPPIRSRWRRGIVIPVAIAASVLFLLAAGAIGTRFFKQPKSPQNIAANLTTVNSPQPTPPIEPTMDGPSTRNAVSGPTKRSFIERQNAMTKIRRSEIRRENQLAEEKREGEQAKAELMLAMHIAGTKLNQVQKSVSSKTVNKG